MYLAIVGVLVVLAIAAGVFALGYVLGRAHQPKPRSEVNREILDIYNNLMEQARRAQATGQATKSDAYRSVAKDIIKEREP